MADDLVTKPPAEAPAPETPRGTLLVYADDYRRLTAEVERLRAALKLFECDCEGEELCFNTDNCRNFIARAALKEDRT
jgi:hypothetical protein